MFPSGSRYASRSTKPNASWRNCDAINPIKVEYCGTVLSVTKNAVIYCRISKDSEGLGLGVERQRKACL